MDLAIVADIGAFGVWKSLPASMINTLSVDSMPAAIVSAAVPPPTEKHEWKLIISSGFLGF